jgi:hydroxyacyl-ACP dehydratase HTD2-like protein with hotdog domain
MTNDSNISNDVLSMIGVEKVRLCKVTERDIKHFAQAIGETNPIYYAKGHANAGTNDALVAPPLFCQTLTYEELPPEMLPPDGSPAELDIPIPAKRTVGGGSEYRIFQRVKAGDTITVTSKLVDVYIKHGKSGLLYFIVVETNFRNQLNEPVAEEVATYIKRV